LDRGFSFTIKRACGFVQHKDRSVLEECSCYGHPLALTTRDNFYGLYSKSSLCR
jgi:hypothetical protein